MFRAGDKVGDYEIVEKLKAGGMATLFLARRRGAAGFAKHVAIKVVHEHLAEDPTFVRMFVDEALLSARIEHPNVVHVEELRELDGRHFLVMEYVPGVSLWQLLASLAHHGRRMSTELAVYIAVKVADGLHAAHEVRGPEGTLLGVVHRDISPQNVLLSYQGTVKLIDFGVAKARGRVQEETSGGSIKGKFRYMSPEQAWGREVDRRSDVYALGTVLWEMLAMRRRFDSRNDTMVLDMVRDPERVPPSRFALGIPEALDVALLRAQEKDPAARFQNAQEFRTALLTAVPGAAMLHDSQLSGLLHAVLAEEIELEATRLPASVTGLLRAHADVGAAPADEPLDTLTISSAGIQLLDDGEPASGAPGGPGGATPSPTPTPTPATPTVAPLHPPVGPPSIHPEAPRSNALLFLAIAATMIAAGLFGVVAVLGFHLAGSPNVPERLPAPVPNTATPASPPTSEAVPADDSLPAAESVDADAQADAVPSGAVADAELDGREINETLPADEATERPERPVGAPSGSRRMNRPPRDDQPRMRMSRVPLADSF